MLQCWFTFLNVLLYQDKLLSGHFTFSGNRNINALSTFATSLLEFTFNQKQTKSFQNLGKRNAKHQRLNQVPKPPFSTSHFIKCQINNDKLNFICQRANIIAKSRNKNWKHSENALLIIYHQLNFVDINFASMTNNEMCSCMDTSFQVRSQSICAKWTGIGEVQQSFRNDVAIQVSISNQIANTYFD